MSITKITYTDKQQLNANASVNAVNKCQATDMNEIKTVVNTNADLQGDLASLGTSVKTDLVSAINEVRTDLINATKSDNTGYIAVDTTTDTISVNANTTYQVQKDVSKTGYTPIGAIQIDVSNNGLTINKWSIYGNTLYARFYNFTSSTISDATITIKVLYIKN